MRNADRLIGKLQRLAPSLQRPIEVALMVSAAEMNNHAIVRVQKNSGTGRVYNRGSRTHTASSPGEYPNTDTGELVRGMFFKQFGFLTVVWGNRAKHAIPLELGTSRMAARPFIRQTFNALVSKARERVGAAVKAALRAR